MEQQERRLTFKKQVRLTCRVKKSLRQSVTTVELRQRISNYYHNITTHISHSDSFVVCKCSLHNRTIQAVASESDNLLQNKTENGTLPNKMSLTLCFYSKTQTPTVAKALWQSAETH